MIVESVDADELRRIMEENSSSPRVVPGTGGLQKKPPLSGESPEPSEEGPESAAQ